MASSSPRKNPFDDLHTLLERMNVPPGKRNSIKELIKYLPLEHSHHKDFDKAEKLLSILMFTKPLPSLYKKDKENQ